MSYDSVAKRKKYTYHEAPPVPEVLRLRADIEKLRAAVTALQAITRRYRDETPIGHQPHMIAHIADAALRLADEAMGAEE